MGWHSSTAEAKSHHSSSDDSSEDSDDDSDDGDDGKDTGGDEGEGENGDDDKDQPPVTAGGLFTIKTYPVSEIARPLTMTEHITQLRLSLGTDVSAKGAFKTLGVSLEGIYGLSDNFSIIGGFTSAYNVKQFGLYAGFEGALIYDLLDIRLAANIHRNAIPNYQNYCTPAAANDPINPSDPATCGGGTAAMPSSAALVNLPNGVYDAGDTKFSLDLGFPFRYAIKPQIAIVALQTLISIDFNAVNLDHTSSAIATDAMGNMTVVNTPIGNKVTPDFEPSLGIATNPVPQVSLVIFGQLRIPDFDTSAGNYQVPVTGRLEVSPSQQFDIGLEFTLLNVLPPDGQSAFDNRFLSLFMQARF